MQLPLTYSVVVAAAERSANERQYCQNISEVEKAVQDNECNKN